MRGKDRAMDGLLRFDAGQNRGSQDINRSGLIREYKVTKSGLYSTTALTLYLSLHAGAGLAQVSELTAEERAVFGPAVQECLVSQSGAATCLPLRDVIRDCAEDVSLATCDILLSDMDALSEDEDMQERAQDVLAELDDTLEALEANALADSADADAAADEIVDAELPEDPDTLEPETDDSPEPEIAAPLEELTDPEDSAAQDSTTADERPEPQSDVAADAEPEAVDDALEDLARALEDLEEGAAPDEGDLLVDPQEVAQDELDALRGAEEGADRALEEERQEMLRAAEAMADEAPELVVEDIAQDEITAPVEAPRELDAAEQAAIDTLMQSPDVASALGILGAMAGVTADTTTTPEDETDARPLAARLPDDAEEGAPQVESEDVTEEQITRDQIRTSRDDFDSRLTLDASADAQARADRSAGDRRDLERAGLVALGALAVGMVINQNRVVARSDERVVVDQGGGALELWRDDDAILLQDGATRRIERFDDGSTRTRWARMDGTETVTIRDATGRVLRRERVLADGTVVVLLDDTRQIDVIDMSTLPPPRTRELRITPRADPELALALLREAEADARALDRRFSLRQIRETRELREMVPLLSPDLITFETNRANVRPEEAAKLLQVGRLMERLVTEDPRELFLIEGHTDATGPAAFNLALSDRRAESVALALTEFFDIPPENLIVQGYGKRYLRIPTLGSEARNRRVAIRRITPLLW
ncbi:MAG: hypothetical protein EA339_00255 [Rhodobacteraceae bacterium]|nr:MAG: hypothetical protein EA339_00255 [Paracoccaceae bacterium]